MDHILLSAALAFLITFFAIPVIIQVAKAKKLFDEPDERKVHKTVIPTLVHHFLLDLGLNHKMVTLTCVGAYHFYWVSFCNA